MSVYINGKDISEWSEVDTYYVGKHGNDANDGLSIARAKLTFGNAITTASAATPAADNIINIVCQDSGDYVENVTCVEYVNIFAPSASFNGAFNLADNMSVRIRKAQRSASNVVGKASGTRETYFFAEEVVSTGGSGSCITNYAINSIINATISTIRVDTGSGVGNSSTPSGHIHLDVGDIYIGGNGGTGIISNGTSSIVGRVDHIIEDGTPTTTTALNILSGSVQLNISSIDTDAAYDVASGGFLSLNVNKIIGTKTNAGTARVSALNSDDDANTHFSVNYDTDAKTILGRSAIGSPTSDTACFSHMDRATAADCAIHQTQGGDTTLNARGTKTITLSIAGGARATIEDTNGFIWNAGSGDYDFAVNGNSVASVLKVDAGTDSISMAGSGELLSVGTYTGNASPAITLRSQNSGYAVPSDTNTSSDGDKWVFWNEANYKGAIGFASRTMWFQSTETNPTDLNRFRFYAGSASSPVELLTLGDGNVGFIWNDVGNDVDFRVESSGSENALFVQGSDGNVGIGTATPNILGAGGPVLTILGSVQHGVLELANKDTIGTESLGHIEFLNLDGGASATARAIIAGRRAGADDAVELTFQTEATGGAVTERMVISSTGNIGIGTDNPSAVMEVASLSTIGMMNTKYSADEFGSNLLLRKSRGATVDSYTIVQDDDQIGLLRFHAADGVDFNTEPARISAEVDDTSPAANNIGGALLFSTATQGGADNNLLERLRIDSAGNVGIGTESPTTTLHVNGSTAYTPSSDNVIAAATGVSAAMLVKRIIRVAGNAGNITITATPSIAAGLADGQEIILQGTSDTDTVTFQDESNLGGSTLALSGGNDFTLGKNDTLCLMWDAGDSLWQEITRSDN